MITVQSRFRWVLEQATGKRSVDIAKQDDSARQEDSATEQEEGGGSGGKDPQIKARR